MGVGFFGRGSKPPPHQLVGLGGIGAVTILRVWGTKQCCERSEQEIFLGMYPTYDILGVQHKIKKKLN